MFHKLLSPKVWLNMNLTYIGLLVHQYDQRFLRKIKIFFIYFHILLKVWRGIVTVLQLFSDMKLCPAPPQLSCRNHGLNTLICMHHLGVIKLHFYMHFDIKLQPSMVALPLPLSLRIAQLHDSSFDQIWVPSS
jgi:hypothetical protein